MKPYIHEHKCQVGYHTWKCEDKDCLGEPIGTRKPSKTRICASCSKVLHGEPEEHESYGLISITRFQSNHAKFFGSSISHSGGMSVDIYTAKKIRNLNADHYHQDRALISVRLSSAQFADLITSPNTGGVPCTIDWFDGKRMEEPPDVAVRAQFVNEFEDKIEKAFARLEEVTQDVENYFKSGKGSRVDIRAKLSEVRRELAANAPFILSQFNRQMDKVVTEAKSEVESFVENKIRSLGVNALESEIARALRAPVESSPLQLEDGSNKEEPEASN